MVAPVRVASFVTATSRFVITLWLEAITPTFFPCAISAPIIRAPV